VLVLGSDRVEVFLAREEPLEDGSNGQRVDLGFESFHLALDFLELPLVVSLQ